TPFHLALGTKYSPTPFKPELLEMMRKSEQQEAQAAQAAQQQQEQNNQLQQAVTSLQVAQGIESIADAEEKRSEIPLNRAKTLTEINKNLASPLLDLIRERVKLEISREKVQNVQRTNA
ncbi:hypothetical protein LCGC14_1918250, partial [marine sediment metagenome]